VRSLPLESSKIDPGTIEAWESQLGDRVEDVPHLRARLGSGSLPEAFAESAGRHSNRPALSVHERTVSHGELDDMAGRAASRLASLGAGRGDRVLLVADVGLEEISVYLGLLRLGATIVLANPMLTSLELAELAAASEAIFLVGSGSPLTAAEKIASGALREIVGLREVDSSQSTVQLDASVSSPSPVSAVDPDATAILTFTSGTTGRPKPTPLTHRNLLASIRGVMAAWRWDRGDHLVHSLPISHQHGLGGIHATLLAGSKATLLGRLDPEAILDAVERAGASIHFGVAAVHQRLLDRLGERAAGLAGLRLAISGSGPLPPDLFERYQTMTGSQLLERYGTTESGLDVSNLYDGPRLAGHVGLPLPGVEIALADEGGNVVTEGVGEVMVRGPHVFCGYLGVSRSDQPFFADWFRTGDLGAIDERTGYLRIVGRSKEVIISGGMNIYPREVEDAIRSFPGVEDVAVAGVASDRWGEEVVAVVTPASLDDAVLAEFVANRLAGYKRPKRIVTTGTIPRNAVGKVVASDLDQLISSGGSGMPSGGIGSSDSQ
jgi:malonyl-CoA/methylmalonyl-CoA synthetase